MAVFLVIDPAAGRRAWLRIFLHPPHEVVEYSSLGESLTACAGRTFQAAFIAWPEGVRPGAADRRNWSCEHVVLLISDPAQAPIAREWCKSVLHQDRITLLSCPGGYLNSAEISRALGRVLDAPEVAFPEMVGSSPAMRQLLEVAARVAANDRPVLIFGEPGTGKEALARWIHARSARGQRPFEPFDCSGLDPALAVSELFGHEKGAFTWAVQAKRGLLAAANEGALYIREASDLDRALQSRLLRFLEQRGGIERLGGQESHNVDVRLIVGSCRPLSERLGEDFSRDLYYRLRQNYIEAPPLRSRPSDIPELAKYLLARQQGAASHSLKWEPRALADLQSYPWPGNLNELEEVVLEAVLKAEPGGQIKLEHLPLRIRNAGEKAGFPAPALRTGATSNGVAQIWPKTDDVDGYKLLKEISTTAGARVMLAEDMAHVLRIAKFSNPRNEDQLEAVKKIMALSGRDREARNFMIPIYYANARAANQWCMVVLDCLDDVRTGRDIDRGLYQPHTFGRWIARRHGIPSPASHDRWSVINHLEAMLHALDFFHRRDLIMNDAKPENFGFFEGRLVVIDYGGFAFRDKQPHELTPVYSPPGDRAGSPADDVYAVAIMMAEALYNSQPEDLRPERVPSVAEHYKREGTLFDKDAWALIVEGLHVFPGRRFPDAPSMIQQLQELKQLLKEEPQEGDTTAPAE